ncbi:hypothetical protein HKX48_003158, partial [Thoreauomyces humboldtii]
EQPAIVPPPAKRPRLVQPTDRSVELDRRSTHVEIRKQELSPAVKKELLRWENHQMNRKLTTRRLELLTTFSFYFCFGVSWEDILESAEGPPRRPEGWEEANALQLQHIEDARFFVFVQSKETGAWMQVIAKAENLLPRDTELLACAASQELALQLLDPARVVIPDPNELEEERVIVKPGCSGGAFQVGVQLPQGFPRLGHQCLRAPRTNPDHMVAYAGSRMLSSSAADTVLQGLCDIYQMFLPTSFARAAEYKAACGRHVPSHLFLPHLTASWNTVVRAHREPPNRIQAMAYIHGPFEGGDLAFPQLNLRTPAPSGTVFWGWTDILDHYVCDYDVRFNGRRGFRAAWSLSLSADAYSEMFANPTKGFYERERFLTENHLFDWEAVYDLTGGSRTDVEAIG